MPNIFINGREINAPEGITIIQACEFSDVEIPRFCYHERLAIAGNCRMCLVEVEGMPPKPVASCAMPISEGMKIHTDTPMVKKAREGAMEFLLANHPLDCPICDQGGECDLQDQAYQYGKGKSNYHELKRSVKDKDMGPLIKTHMTRCIHCTRCVRFIEDVAGTTEIGAVNRGENMEITTYLEKSISSELSGNIIDLCPVGALTSKPYAFKVRSWELQKTESIDIMDAVGSNIRIDSRGNEVMRILPALNEEINEEWISDKARFCYDGLKYQRLDRAYIKKYNKFEAISIDEAVKIAAEKIKSLSSYEIAALTSDLSSVEENFAIKKLMEKIGSKNYECRLRNEKINYQDRSSYLFNSKISSIDEADAILLVAVNPRKDAAVLNARIRKRWLTKKLKVAAIGVSSDLTYDYENLGETEKSLENILNGESRFAKILSEAKNPMIIIGSDLAEAENGFQLMQYCKKIAEKYQLIRDDWNGFNFLSKSTGLINGLEIGFAQENSDINSILTKCQNSEIKLIILHSVDDHIDFDKLKNCFVIYIGSHGDKGVEVADLILPTAAFSEKERIYLNLEGRVQISKRAVFAPAEAKEEIDLIVKLAQELEFDLGFNNLGGLRKLIFSQFPHLAEINEVTSAIWQNSENDVKNKILPELSDKKISTKDYNFYLTNAITRASRTLNKI
jgi:NADH-quinone oxidoreductase subunit G